MSNPEISKIILPNEMVYDIKDTELREAIKGFIGDLDKR